MDHEEFANEFFHKKFISEAASLNGQKDFLQLIRTASSYNLTKIRLPISLTKWVTMRLGDVFQFVTMHNERHLVQAQSRIQS